MILVFFLSLFESASEYFQVLLIKAYIDNYENEYDSFDIQNIKYVGIIFIVLQFITIFVNLQNRLIQQKMSLRITVLLYIIK